ncbi:hypothetical protein QOT17_012335 [Balamuthia mandrillaris]
MLSPRVLRISDTSVKTRRAPVGAKKPNKKLTKKHSLMVLNLASSYSEDVLSSTTEDSSSEDEWSEDYEDPCWVPDPHLRKPTPTPITSPHSSTSSFQTVKRENNETAQEESEEDTTEEEIEKEDKDEDEEENPKKETEEEYKERNPSPTSSERETSIEKLKRLAASRPQKLTRESSLTSLSKAFTKEEWANELKEWRKTVQDSKSPKNTSSASSSASASPSSSTSSSPISSPTTSPGRKSSNPYRKSALELLKHYSPDPASQEKHKKEAQTMEKAFARAAPLERTRTARCLGEAKAKRPRSRRFSLALSRSSEKLFDEVDRPVPPLNFPRPRSQSANSPTEHVKLPATTRSDRRLSRSLKLGKIFSSLTDLRKHRSETV